MYSSYLLDWFHTGISNFIHLKLDFTQKVYPSNTPHLSKWNLHPLKKYGLTLDTSLSFTHFHIQFIAKSCQLDLLNIGRIIHAAPCPWPHHSHQDYSNCLFLLLNPSHQLSTQQSGHFKSTDIYLTLYLTGHLSLVGEVQNSYCTYKTLHGLASAYLFTLPLSLQYSPFPGMTSSFFTSRPSNIPLLLRGPL